METTLETITYHTYARYKNSGVAWLGEIPEHWEVRRLKFVGRYQKGKNPKRISANETGYQYLSMDVLRGNQDKILFAEFSEGLVKVETGDILVLWDGSNSGEIVLGMEGILSSTMAKFKFIKKIENRFGWYCLKRLEIKLRETTVGMGIPHVNSEEFENLPFILPPLPEQAAIAAFLDKKTGQIEAAIARKERQIELLKEHRQILIHTAVTRGLNPHAPLKPSGVEWIGDVPAHWEVKKLKFLGNSIIGLTYNPSDLCNQEEGTLVLRSSNLFEGKFKYGEKENAYVKSRIPSKLLIRENDILICSRNGSRDLIGKCALATKVDEGNTFGAFTTVFRSNINPYMFCILNSSIFKALSGMFLTSTINQLTIGNLNSIEVPIPPLDEMDAIRHFIENMNIKVENAVFLKETEITTLKELKASLINAAVTGKIKVPTTF